MDDRARQACERCGSIATRFGRFCEACLTVDEPAAFDGRPVCGGFVPCETCDGSGERIRHDDTAEPCRDCEGFGTVWLEPDEHAT